MLLPFSVRYETVHMTVNVFILCLVKYVADIRSTLEVKDRKMHKGVDATYFLNNLRVHYYNVSILRQWICHR